MIAKIKSFFSRKSPATTSAFVRTSDNPGFGAHLLTGQEGSFNYSRSWGFTPNL